MTGLDWVIVGLVLLLAVFGWAQGFVAGALALVGFAVGRVDRDPGRPARCSPTARESPYAPAFGLLGALLAGAVVAAGLEGLGWRLRGRLRAPGAGGGRRAARRGADRLRRASGSCWVLGAVAVHSAGGELRAEVQRSMILRELNERLPPSGPLLNVLARFDPFPRIDGPDPGVGAPRRPIARRRGRRGGRRERREDPRHGVRAGRRGLGLGGRAGRSWSPTPTSSPARTTRACCPRGAAAGWTPARSSSTPATTSPCCASRARTRRRCRSPTRAAQRRVGGRSSASPLNGPYDVRAARVGATRGG